MTSQEIRQSFLDFFREKEHRIVPSAPVVPHGDPTLLFTNAGMNQFKDVFLGEGKRDFSRATDTQKCIRVSGKHNDLEEVGYDTYHHTLFEMLGNWSFGDYYKEEAIAWAWELLVDKWGLDTNRLYATVYRTDDEAMEIWKKYLPEERILRFDEKDNFWEMGDTGPCGPCSEIHYDLTVEGNGRDLVNADSPEVIEIWNLVFIQYNRSKDGTLTDLPSKHVDTGMGFERICMVKQGKRSNYDTDVFSPLLQKISSLCDIPYTSEDEKETDIAMRVIVDHIRTLSFAIADGAIPGNTGRGYVLRRILRRASRYARKLDCTEPILFKLVQTVVDTMGSVFPEVVEQQQLIEQVIKSEEEAFLQTLERGLEKFDEITSKGENTVSGENAFLLYDTFGFPLDLTELLARERNCTVDVDGFNANMEAQKERSRAARKSQSQEAQVALTDETTEFVGYEETSSKSPIIVAKNDLLVLQKTPFYAESGGQVADKGTITVDGHAYNVLDVRKSGSAFVHILDTPLESISENAVAFAEINISQRDDICANHSATHILHEALRQVLGTHVQQAGSAVTADYLRFDFPHFQKITAEEISDIEAIVNDKIRENIAVQIQNLPIEEAQKIPHVKMFFGDKYGDVVRVVFIDENFSVEFCGGTHVGTTSEIGLFKITGESSIASGTRRVEAVTGRGIETYIDNLHATIRKEQDMNVGLQERIKELERTVQQFQFAEQTSLIGGIVQKAVAVGDIRVAVGEVGSMEGDQFKALGDELRNDLGANGIGLLAQVNDGKVQLVCVATDDVKKKFPAGKLVGLAAKEIGGGGGGKPHLATAGGKNAEALSALLEKFPSIVQEYGA
jgi:alanyl-tRNA synthetase